MNLALLPPYNEAALLTLLKLHDRKGFQELHDRFAPKFLSILMHKIPHREQAEDLLQDSFIKIWSNIHRYDSDKGRLFTWMLRIVHNTALDYLQTIPKVYVSIDTVPLDRMGTVTMPYQIIGLTGRVNSVLTDKQRQLIELVYFQGYTQQEIVAEFGFPLGTVKTRIRMALSQLRKVEDYVRPAFRYVEDAPNRGLLIKGI